MLISFRFTPAGWVAVLSIAGILAAILYRLLQKKKEEKALPEYQVYLCFDGIMPQAQLINPFPR